MVSDIFFVFFPKYSLTKMFVSTNNQIPSDNNDVMKQEVNMEHELGKQMK